MKKLMVLSMVLTLATMSLLNVVPVKADDEPSPIVIQPADEQGTPAQPEPQEQIQSQTEEEKPQQDPPAPEQAPEPGPRY